MDRWTDAQMGQKDTDNTIYPLAYDEVLRLHNFVCIPERSIDFYEICHKLDYIILLQRGVVLITKLSRVRSRSTNVFDLLIVV